MKSRFVFALALLALLMLVGCAGESQQVEVTRVVTEQVPVTVEVTRIVEQQVVQQVPVEVTRIVEVVATAMLTEAAAEESTPEPSPTPTVEPTPETALAGATYTVQPGDSMFAIAQQAGITIAALQAANNMTESSVLIAGQEIVIPGVDAELPPVAPAAPEEATAVPAPEQVPDAVVAAGANLLPNPSFEEDWHFYLYNELQIPDGWQLSTDEGPNTLEQGSGGLFNRPEVRVVPAKDLPSAEHQQFIFDGIKTVKAFKGGAPTSFAMFTDVPLQPGTYRMTINFVPDTVEGYNNGQKIYASNPLAAEARVIVDNGGTAWQGTNSGQRNTLTYDFSVGEARNVRVGGAFRNRNIMVNNGWFLDNWSLTPVTVQ